jgi:hypothetical protein
LGCSHNGFGALIEIENNSLAFYALGCLSFCILVDNGRETSAVVLRIGRVTLKLHCQASFKKTIKLPLQKRYRKDLEHHANGRDHFQILSRQIFKKPLDGKRFCSLMITAGISPR